MNSDTFLSIETWNSISMQLLWRLITTPSSSQQWILQEIRYVTGSLATGTTLFSFCDTETEKYTPLHWRVAIWRFSYCVLCSWNTIYIYVFKYRQHFKAQTWRLLCNCRSLRGVCNIPLYSLELFYRLQKEYMVMFCCKISHWGHTVIHQACHWPLQCFCLYQQGCHMVVVIWYHWSIS